MPLLALLHSADADTAVLHAASRLAGPSDPVVVCSILPQHAVAETRSSRPAGSRPGPRVSFEGTTIATATGQLLPTQRLRAEPAESRASAAARLIRGREIQLRSLLARELPGRPCVIEVDVARSPAQRVLRIARRHGVELIVTASGALPWHERLLNGDPVRELIAAEVSVFIVPAGQRESAAAEEPGAGDASDFARLVAATSAPAFALDERYRICALNGAAEEAFVLNRARVVGLPCYRALRPVDPAAEEHCGEDCPLLERLRAGAAVDFGSHVWRSADRAVPFAAVSIPVPRSLLETERAVALVVATGP